MRHALYLIAGVAAAIIASKLLLENVLGLQLDVLVQDWISQHGSTSAVIIVGLLAADLFLPIPSSLVMVLAGAAFGTWWGAALSLVGSVGGEWLGFELVRRYGRRAAARIVGDAEIEHLSRVFAKHGAAAVVVTRALPVVMETTSVVAGLSAMKRSTFLVASLLGTGPIVFVYAYAGAMSRKTNSLVPAIVMLVAVAGLGWVIYRVRMSND